MGAFHTIRPDQDALDKIFKKMVKITVKNLNEKLQTGLPLLPLGLLTQCVFLSCQALYRFVVLFLPHL